MRKTLNFGKIDFNGTGRKINAVTIEIKLEDGIFGAHGEIWNAHNTDIISGGQILDIIAIYIHTSLFLQIYRLWKLYRFKVCEIPENDIKQITEIFKDY